MLYRMLYSTQNGGDWALEQMFQGYCRAQDQARIVLCELCAGEAEIDCNYDGCVYRANCQIGRAITAWLRENGCTDSVPDRN